MKTRILGGLVLSALSALAACRPLLLPEAGSASSPSASPTGRVAITVPSIAPPLAKALGVTMTTLFPASRVLLIATRADLELWRSGSLVDTLSYATVDQLGVPQPPVLWTVPAAQGYTLHARVFNGNVSTTVPVLYGVSEPFDVVAGSTTAVAVRPIPSPPTTIAPAAIPLVPTETTTTLTQSEERWFTIDASAKKAVLVTATGDAHTAAIIVAADEEGRRIGWGFSGAVGATDLYYLNYGGSARLGVLGGGVRYIGLIAATDSADQQATSNVSLSYVDYEDDAYEENDSPEQAYPISSGEVIQGVVLEPEFALSASHAGDWYSFTVDDPSGTGQVNATLTFDAEWSPLGMVIQGPAPSTQVRASALASSVSGPIDPDALETAQISTDLANGTYYLSVTVNGPMTLGTPYELAVDVGAASVDVTIE